MEIIKKLETAVSKKVEQWNVEDLQKIVDNEDLRKSFVEPDVLDECIKLCSKNKEIETALIPLAIKTKYKLATTKISEIGNNFLQKKISEEEFIKSIDDSINNSNIYERFLSYYLLVTLLPDKSSEYETKMREDCIYITNEIESLMSSDSEVMLINYSVVDNLLDLVYPLRTKYYQIKNIDIYDAETSEKLKNVVESLNSIEQQILESLYSNKKSEGDKKDE